MASLKASKLKYIVFDPAAEPEGNWSIVYLPIHALQSIEQFPEGAEVIIVSAELDNRKRTPEWSACKNVKKLATIKIHDKSFFKLFNKDFSQLLRRR